MTNDAAPADDMSQASSPAHPAASDDAGTPPLDWAALRATADRRRRRRRLVGGAVAAVLVATGAIGVWLVVGDDGSDQPVRHTAEFPTGFGAYRLADEGDSVWEQIGRTENRDATHRTARATYRDTNGKRAYAITLDLDPIIDVSDPGEDDAAVSMILGTDVTSDATRSYDPGSIGGTLRCVRYEVAETTSARCVWGNKAATVTAQPVITSGPRPTPDQTARDTRAFLAELRVSEAE
ncbi:hypothetical protein [Streptomyces sp. NPDC057676]